MPTPKRWVMITSCLRVIRLIHDFGFPHFFPSYTGLPNPQKPGSCSHCHGLVNSIHRGLKAIAERGACRYPHARRPSNLCIGCYGILFLGGSTRDDKTLPNPELCFPGVSEFNTMLSCCNHTENSLLTLDLHYLRRYAATTFRD